MSTDVSVVMAPLIKRKLFTTEEEAIRELLREYILRQIAALRREMGRFERKYGMHFDRFGEVLHERSVVLETGALSSEARPALGQALYQLFTEVPLLRWDNKEEFRQLATYPHHHHDEQGNVKASPLTGDPLRDLEVVLQEVSGFLSDKAKGSLTEDCTKHAH